MFRSKLASALSALVVSTAPASALAEALSNDFARPGFYLALGAGAAITTSAEDDLQEIVDVAFPGSTAEVSTSPNVGFRFGNRFSRHFAMELDLEYLIGFDGSIDGVKIGEAKGVTATANLRGYLLTGRFQPYGLFGLGVMYGNLSDSLGLGVPENSVGFAIRVGAGLEIYLSEKIFLDLGAAYLIPFEDLDDLDHVSIRGSIGYRF
jgi:opacity protein-like surface antigen